jgi:DNA-binding NarL/FixJ family response regulator
MTPPIRILLVDDHVLFRKGVEAVLQSRPDMEVVGEAGDGCEAIALARATKPDVILMDVMMPHCNGLEATRAIKGELPDTHIVMITVSEDEKDLFEAIKSGAQGYLTKDLKANLLFEVIAGVARGEAHFSGVIATKILNEFQQPEPAPANLSGPVESLTDREIEVLELIVAGSSNKEIADKLVLSESTVKNHLQNILGKLHLQNRVQAAVYAVRQELVPPPAKTP